MDADLKHQITADIKAVTADLGRVPTRDEYFRQSMGKHSEKTVRRVFGSFGIAVQAAGLVPQQFKRIKVTAEDLFARDVAEHLDAQIPAPDNARLPDDFAPTIAIGDLHFPFAHKPSVSRCLEFIGDMKPKRAVQLGDLFDMYSWGKFPRSKNIYNPHEEMRRARADAESFWTEVQRRAPGIECWQLLGNHDARPLKRAIEAAPEIEIFLRIDNFYEFPGVHLVADPRQELILDGIAFLHGYRSGLGDHRDHMLMSVVCGHTHKGGVDCRQVRGEILFELNAGYLGDPDTKAFSYTPQRAQKWTRGWGWIDKWGPRFVPA